MGMLTGKEILLLDLYSFQRWPDVRAAFDRFGSYTPSWSAARRQAVADDGDTDWWNAISPAYRWMMGEMERKGMPCPNPVLLQCLFDRFGSVFPQCGLMVFPGVVIVSR